VISSVFSASVNSLLTFLDLGVNGIGGFTLMEGYMVALCFVNLLIAIILLKRNEITVFYVEIIE
jgi:hypothetical protein